jgi:hypothetical protein
MFLKRSAGDRAVGFLDGLKKRAGQKDDALRIATLSKAITIYNQDGVPIVSQLDSLDEVSRKAMEGGFLVAITQFSNMKLADEDQMTTISFESKENGTFVITKTHHFIGSLLWQEHLGLPIDFSKNALASLVQHLESSCKAEDTEAVQRHVQQFIATFF